METVAPTTQNLERTVIVIGDSGVGRREAAKLLAEKSMREVINCFDDATREGLRETPRRYVKFLAEFLSPPEFEMTTFDGTGVDQMVIVADIPFYSLCEHHLAPFFGTGSIAYIPNGKIVGLSKLARTLDKFARRLQNQERITTEIAEFLNEALAPKGVAVALKAQHLCMSMRGVQKSGTWTHTSKMLGAFMDDSEARAEFLQLIKS